MLLGLATIFLRGAKPRFPLLSTCQPVPFHLITYQAPLRPPFRDCLRYTLSTLFAALYAANECTRAKIFVRASHETDLFNTRRRRKIKDVAVSLMKLDVSRENHEAERISFDSFFSPS